MHVINTFQVVFVCVCVHVVVQCCCREWDNEQYSNGSTLDRRAWPFSNQQVLGLTVWLFTSELVTSVAHPMASY